MQACCECGPERRKLLTQETESAYEATCPQLLNCDKRCLVLFGIVLSCRIVIIIKATTEVYSSAWFVYWISDFQQFLYYQLKSIAFCGIRNTPPFLMWYKFQESIEYALIIRFHTNSMTWKTSVKERERESSIQLFQVFFLFIL